MKSKRWIFIAATVVGLVMLESPIILAANTFEPTILGFPFLVSWVIFWWAFCTINFLVAHIYDWGDSKKEPSEPGGDT